MITTGFAQGNGQVESINAILEAVMSHIAIKEPLKWYKNISRVQRSLNGTCQRSIATSPFQLLLGSKIQTLEDHELLDKIKCKTARHFQQIHEESRVIQYNLGDLVTTIRTQKWHGLKVSAKYVVPPLATTWHGFRDNIEDDED